MSKVILKYERYLIEQSVPASNVLMNTKNSLNSQSIWTYYHLDIKELFARQMCYNIILYHTKLYNERVNSFNIFSEEE
jgi:hypothetical protein